MLRSLALSALAFLLLLDGTLQADNWPKFPGSDLKVADAVSQSDGIFIGKIPHMDLAASTVQANYGGVGANVLEVLRGQFSAHVLVEFTVYMAKKDEEKPYINDPYIFFTRRDSRVGRDPEAIKVVPATPENISMVRHLIAPPNGK